MRSLSLCTGYGGLELAVEDVFGAVPAYVSEVDPSACAVIEARFPGVPNIGDLTVMDWSTLEPVDVLTAGYPCQPFSTAGRRQGAKDARHLWPFIARAIGVLRPRIVVLENVSGHLSMGAGAVIGDLAGEGYDCRWGVVRASDVGACHRRARVFIVAYPQSDEGWLIDGDGRIAPHPAGVGHRAEAGDQAGRADAGRSAGGTHRPGARPVADAGSPRRREVAGGAHGDEATHGRRPTQRDHQPVGDGSPSGDDGRVGLEAPAHTGSERRNGRETVEGGWRDSSERCQAGGDVGDSAGPSVVTDAAGAGRGPHQRSGPGALPRVEVDGWPAGEPRRHDRSDEGGAVQWGAYGPAIERHAAVLGRPAPHPVDGRGRLNPLFVEWMMMLPAGWVTDIVTSRSKALKALGNGVVPPQAAYALRLLRERRLEAAA